MKCEHKWIDMEDGTLDQFCVRCSLKQMRNVMKLLSAEISAPIAMPFGREKMEVPYLTPSGDHTRVEVYKDDLIKRINEEIGLSINHFSKPMGR